MITNSGAYVMGIDGYGLDIDCVADFVVVPGETAAEAVAAHPQRRAVVKRGRVIAREGRALLPPVT